jgi:DnaK suppressor protein
MKKATSVKIKKEEGTVETVKNRYSDEELEEFRQIILSKLEKAHNDLKLLTESYTTGNDHDTNDTSPTFKVLEEGYQVFSKEENSKFAARQSKFIKALENALIRIENKSYGICRATGKLIPKDRLRIVPHATLSIEAKRQQTTTPVMPTQQQTSQNY